MNNLLLTLIMGMWAFSSFVEAAEIPKAGTYNAGVQVSIGAIDHDNFNDDHSAVVQATFYQYYYFKPGWAVEVGLSYSVNTAQY